MINPQMKRAAALYRVSTKKQMTENEDIPLQKKECREFIILH
jgi:DNA invertase Pin-like site-specific DNA recombinase